MSEMPEEIYAWEFTEEYGLSRNVWGCTPPPNDYPHIKYIRSDRYEALKQVAEKMAGALKKCEQELSEEIKNIGGCDHSVGMCCCPLIYAADWAQEALQAYEKLKGE